MDEVVAARQLKRGEIGRLEYFVSRYQVKATRAAFLVTHDQARAGSLLRYGSSKTREPVCRLDIR